MRYRYIDILRLLCAFLVVCIHCPYKDTFGFWLEPLTRIAVPVFFMISGYFFFDVCEKNIKKQIGRTFRTAVLWYAVYGIAEFCLGLHPVLTEGWVEYTRDNVLGEFAKFVLVNKPMLNLGAFLWYMFALGYIYLIFGWAYKRQKVNLLMKGGLLLLILQYMIGMYSFVFDMPTTVIRTRNFLFTGIPFFSLGIWLRKRWEAGRISYRPGGHILLKVLIVSSLLFGIFEKYVLLSCVGIEIHSDLYLSTLFLSVTLFYGALLGSHKNTESKWIDKIAEAGRKYSGGVYFTHSIFLCVIDWMFYWAGVNEQSFLFHIFPMIIFLVSLLCVVWIQKSSQEWPKRKCKQEQ